uniref:Uncharacterized protein n=1 Tax=Meloidogyne incognita TaxID=6306 RepID=A0A914MNQ8_MELIC
MTISASTSALPAPMTTSAAGSTRTTFSRTWTLTTGFDRDSIIIGRTEYPLLLHILINYCTNLVLETGFFARYFSRE